MRMGMGRYARGGDAPKPKNPLESLSRVLPWIMPYWPVLLFGLICMFSSTFLSQQPPRLIRFVTNDILLKHQYGLLSREVLLLIGLYFGMSLTQFLRTYWLHVAGQRLLHTLRVRLYEHYQRLSLTYYDNNQTGDLMSRMTSDVEQIENLMVHGLDVLIMGLFGMILAFYYMYGINHVLALLVLVPIPVLAISIYVFSRSVRSIYRNIRDRIGYLNAKLQDNITGMRVIKAFTREEPELGHVTNNSEDVFRMNVRGIRMWSSFGPSMGFLSSLGSVIVIGVGAHLAITGRLLVGDLFAFIMYVGNFYQPIGSFFQFFDSIQRSLAAGERILEVLDTAPDIQDPDTPAPLDTVVGYVEFKQVSFSYATGDEVLHDISVEAKPGERVALVGRSGAGKTSFINLIPRFYDVLEGQVLVDGIDVRHLRQHDLRKHIALVLQETFLFNGSVRDNLRYGKLDATDEEMIEAAKAANAYEFVEKLTDGFDTEIGERGVKLSGGQRQRLAIARAILADPRILILDEATSSVDSESEFLIHQALERLMEGRTTFIIAHRLSTIKHADKILVLEGGSIVESGSHNELVESEGRYAQMYRQQFWLDELFKTETPGEQQMPSFSTAT